MMLYAKFGWNWPRDPGELESLTPKDALCQVWLKLAKRFWKRRFLNLANIFSLFRNYLPLEKVEALYLNKFESSSLKDPLYKFWMLFALWFCRRRFFKFVNVFSPFRNYLPLKEDEALNMNKLEFPSPKDDFCQFWLKLTQWFWRRRFYFKFVNVFSQFLNYLPLEKGVALYLNKIEFPSPKDVLCQPHFWRPKFIIIMNFSDKALKI